MELTVYIYIVKNPFNFASSMSCSLSCYEKYSQKYPWPRFDIWVRKAYIKSNVLCIYYTSFSNHLYLTFNEVV